MTALSLGRSLYDRYGYISISKREERYMCNVAAVRSRGGERTTTLSVWFQGTKVQDTHRLLQQRSRWRQVTREVHKAARATMRQGVPRIWAGGLTYCARPSSDPRAQPLRPQPRSGELIERCTPAPLNCCAWRKKVASRALMKDGAAPTPPCMLLEKRAACALAWARPAPCHSALRRARATAGGLIVQYCVCGRRRGV